MRKLSSRLAPLALVSLLAASSLALASCSNDDEANRQASGGKVMAWKGSVGNSFGDYRGIEADFVNSYRHAKSPVEVGVAGTGKFCPDDPGREEPCRDIENGIAPKAVPHNEYGKWKSYNGEVQPSVLGGRFKSTLSWVTPDTPEGDISHSITFAIVNPAARKPRFIIKAAPECLAKQNEDVVVALTQNGSQTLDSQNDDPFCQTKLKVTRLSDSKEFIRFTIELL